MWSVGKQMVMMMRVCVCVCVGLSLCCDVNVLKQRRMKRVKLTVIVQT